MPSTEQAPDATTAGLEQAIKAATDSEPSLVGYFGAIDTEQRGRFSWWSIRSEDAVPRLLAIPDYKVVQILSVLGSEVRLAMLRALLDAPKTAAELVVELNLSTTGQAYHHLRELERAGYVEQRGGRYYLQMRLGRVYLTALA